MKNTSGEKSSFFRSDFFKAISLVVLTAIVTQSVNYIFWTRQFISTKEQKILEFKIATYEKYVNAITNAIFLSEGSSYIYLEEQRLTDLKYDSIVKVNGKATLTEQMRENVIEKTKANKKLQRYYEMLEKAMHTQNEYQAASLTIELLFSPKVKGLKDILDNTFQPHYTFNYFGKLRRELDLSPNQVNIRQAVIQLVNDRYTLRNNVLDAMIKEIKSE